MTEELGPQDMLPTNLHDIPALQTVAVREGVELSPLTPEDSDAILAILEADPSIRERVSVASKMHTHEDVADQVNAYQNDDHTIRYVIREGDDVIGLVSFWRDVDSPFDAPDRPNDYGFGFFLSPDKRGTGIVAQAVQRIMDIAVENLHVENFIAYCEEDNTDSIAVLTRLGLHATDVSLAEQNSGWIEQKYIKEVSAPFVRA